VDSAQPDRLVRRHRPPRDWGRSWTAGREFSFRTAHQSCPGSAVVRDILGDSVRSDQASLPEQAIHGSRAWDEFFRSSRRGVRSHTVPAAETGDTRRCVHGIVYAVDFFVDAIGCDLLYRKGPFGDPEGRSMERRLDMHPDATASLAMLRCGPTMNLELFEWEAPDQDETPPNNSDIGAMHLALQVEDIDMAMDGLADRDDITMLDGPQTNEDGPTEGLIYVYSRVEWGLYLELLKAPEKMPYADDTDERLYGPIPSWTHRPDHSD
jgi:hypothetical protein